MDLFASWKPREGNCSSDPRNTINHCLTQRSSIQTENISPSASPSSQSRKQGGRGHMLFGTFSEFQQWRWNQLTMLLHTHHHETVCEHSIKYGVNHPACGLDMANEIVKSDTFVHSFSYYSEIERSVGVLLCLHISALTLCYYVIQWSYSLFW